MQTNNMNNYSNDDWWFSAIGGYSANDMLNTLAEIDPGRGCGNNGCSSTTCTTIIEGFDGIPDKLVDEFTVTYGLSGKTGGAGTSTKGSESVEAQKSITSTSSSPPVMSRGSNTNRSSRRGKRINRGRGYPSGDFGYDYIDPGYYWYDNRPEFIPVPVEVPVEVPVQAPFDYSLGGALMPAALVLSAIILVVGFGKTYSKK